MLYFEQPDGSSHQFLLTDPRQASDPRNAAIDRRRTGQGQGRALCPLHQGRVQPRQRCRRRRSSRRSARGTASRAATSSWCRITGSRRSTPRSSANNLLSAALVAGGFSPSLINTSVVIRTSGPAANVYINLAGRESGGTVDAAHVSIAGECDRHLLRDVEDPNPALQLFAGAQEAVQRRHRAADELRPAGLLHEPRRRPGLRRHRRHHGPGLQFRRNAEPRRRVDWATPPSMPQRRSSRCPISTGRTVMTRSCRP